MSSSLDRSLGDIIASNRKNRRESGKGGAGGVRKRPQRAAAQKATAAVTTKAAPKPAASALSDKIIVSNLPYDITEAQIKDYFSEQVGAIKRCFLTYGPDGRSRGVATIVFNKDGDANKAFDKFNGVMVDKRAMKIEVVVDPAKKSLADRVGPVNKPAPAPKPAAAKPKPAGQQQNKGGKKGKRGGKPNTRKPKTAEELDAEMVDYFGGDQSNAAATAPAPAAAPAADTNMEEEVL